MPKSYEKPGNREDFRVFTGTPKGTRTPDLLIRSQSLYPTELSAHVAFLKRLDTITCNSLKVKYFFQNISIFLYNFSGRRGMDTKGIFLILCLLENMIFLHFPLVFFG